MLDADFALFNVDQLVTVAPGCHPAARGDLGVIERGALAARDGTIVWVGPMEEFDRNVALAADALVVNTHGRTVLPGFVDPHTHLIFAGDRSGDFYARALGARYAEQLGSGGLMQTVDATRAASDDDLLDLAYLRAETFLRYGTTTIEAKTGYGLTEADELRGLRVLTRLQHLSPLKIIPAFLGAHVVPAEFHGDARAYIEAVVSWLPAVRDHARFVDAWFDEGAFDVEDGRRVLSAARELGFELTAHANELGPHGGARAAAELQARSVDHVVYLDDADIEALRRNGTVAVLLPGTTFFLNHDTYAPARRLLDAGVRVALGTDFNPGTSYTQNMQFILTLAVLKLGMTPEEAIRAATVDAAAAVDLEDRVGSLAPGKSCNLAVFRLNHYRHIPYHYAMNTVETVVAGGQLVVDNGQIITQPLVTA